MYKTCGVLKKKQLRPYRGERTGTASPVYSTTRSTFHMNLLKWIQVPQFAQNTLCFDKIRRRINSTENRIGIWIKIDELEEFSV